MPVEIKVNIGNFKRAAIATPVLFLAASFGVGCNTQNQKEPPKTPSQTSGQPTGEVKAAQAAPTSSIASPTPFVEQFGEATPQTPKATTENPTPTIDSNGFILFEGKDYRYRLLSEADSTLEKITNPDYLNFFDKWINNTPASDAIKRHLIKARELEKVNPQDSGIITETEAAANILNMHCNDNGSTGLLMQTLASNTYHQNHPAWPTNERIYIKGKCFWGEKTVVSDQHEVINLEGGLFLYKGISYDDLLSEKNLAPLRAVLTQPQTLDENVIQPLRGAQKIDAQNPDDPQLHNYFYVVVDRLHNICSTRVQGKEYMRLVASFLYEKHPQEWKYINDFSMITCLTDTQN